MKLAHVRTSDLLQLGIARTNVEKIMSTILEQEVYFNLNFRNANDSRFNIKLKNNDSMIAPALDSLSSGQIALFNMFTTIIRYADYNNIGKSINLSNITGIVVIDEIELHLHSSLQRDILPQLIRLFPKVQFVITSHSPLFLLGMNELFGENGYGIYEMPTGENINAEAFSEFQNAYNFYTQTLTHQEEIRQAIQFSSDKTLIITEGATDWRHILAAYNKLKTDPNYESLFECLNFEILKYDPKNSIEGSESLKLEMGWSPLCTMCESLSKINQKRKIIFIADRDNKDANKKLAIESAPYKDWGNNIFSFILPLPSFRNDTPEICIEHLYSDMEIKTEYSDANNGTVRRLYIGNEFDERGLSLSRDTFCQNRNSCGLSSISIIDGTEKGRVTRLEDAKTNLAMSKMDFAIRVLSNEHPFNNFDFSNFLPIFKTIKDIDNLPLM